jgi:hypothetical protein
MLSSLCTTTVTTTVMSPHCRYSAYGKWPADDSLVVADYSKEHEVAELRAGPARIVTRHCGGGHGVAGGSVDGTFLDTPASFECLSSTAHCYHDSPVSVKRSCDHSRPRVHITMTKRRTLSPCFSDSRFPFIYRSSSCTDIFVLSQLALALLARPPLSIRPRQ